MRKVTLALITVASIVACHNERSPARSRVVTSAEVAALDHVAPPLTQANTEEYATITENQFVRPAEQPLSTFSIDVDRASYANVRRFLTHGQRPPRDAVRIEEMVNYFTYDYPDAADAPFSITTELAACPWNTKNRLLMIGLQGKRMAVENLPPNNLVFLIDTSGSMMSEDKLPLVKAGLRLLVEQLRPMDRVAIVTYAGSAGLVLESTSGSNKSEILSAIDELEAGGSTAGAEGIVLAYRVAKENFLGSGNNRVILATDGDFNVGISSDGELEELITEKRRDGIFLTVLGFGTGNLKDSKMELLADKGNGNYAYIDTLAEARKTLVQEMGATLFTIARDVKIQVALNPAQVEAYRLIGYENRLLNNKDFDDDAKDAGELGAGHSVTALYEIVPAGGASEGNLATISLRYKEPASETSRLLSHDVAGVVSGAPSKNFRTAAAVAELGMLLRESEHRGEASYESVMELGREQPELVALAEKAKGL